MFKELSEIFLRGWRGMLNTQSNRLDYREILSPPPYYKTSFVIGTTYSLDLETLTATCAIVGLNLEADTDLNESPLHMLEAVRKASSKLILFCQSGQIKVPNKPNKLIPLLESCVCEINLPNKKAFHPKTWFIKYTAEKMPDRYRIVVLSRNLTFDRSWDIALQLDSAIDDETIIPQGEDSDESICTFLKWLWKNTETHNKQLKSKRKRLSDLSDEFAKCNWKSLGKEFDSLDFLTYGIGLPRGDNLNDTFHKMFVISPFLSKSVIEDYSKNRLSNPDCTLITRKSELSKLNKELLTAFETYTVKDDIIDGEERISETGDSKSQDIHAKVYLRTKDSNSDLYIGSANATVSAFTGGNVECLIALRGKQRYLNVERFKQDLFGKDERKNPFEPVEPMEYSTSDEDDVINMLENAIKDFSYLRKTANVSSKEPYEIIITIRKLTADIKMTLSPLMKANNQVISEKIIFSGLSLRDLSEWYVVTAKKRGREVSRVIKIPTTGIPYDNRDSAIFNDIIKDKNAFLSYIAFLLCDDYLSAFLENIKKGSDDFRFLNVNYDTPILYERMLKAVAKSPESLREIRNIIELANDNVIPKDFLELYEQFEKVIRK